MVLREQRLTKMKCEQRNCDNEVFPTPQHPNKKYCTLYCTRREVQLRRQDREFNILKDKYLVADEEGISNEDDCRYCKNSNHTGFCCVQHKRIYEEIMLPIDNALGR